MDDTQDAAAFEAGYSNQPTETPVAKEPEPKPEVKEPEPKPEPEAKTEAPKAAPTLEEMWARMEKFQGITDKLAGHVGRIERTSREIQQNLATAQAAAKKLDDAPTQGEISSASKDPEEWATLKQQYPDWAAATEKMVAARTQSFDANAFEQKVNAAIDGKTAEMQSRIVDASLNAVFPGWRQDVASPEFAAWAAAQPDDIKALTQSSDVGDAARMLKLYEQSKAAPAPTAPTQQAVQKEPSPREKRLAAAVAPKGTGGHPPGRSEIDEFEAGYSG